MTIRLTRPRAIVAGLAGRNRRPGRNRQTPAGPAGAAGLEIEYLDASFDDFRTSTIHDGAVTIFVRRWARAELN